MTLSGPPWFVGFGSGIPVNVQSPFCHFVLGIDLGMSLPDAKRTFSSGACVGCTVFENGS